MIFVEFFEFWGDFLAIFFKIINEFVTEYSFLKYFSQNALPI
jgi:hypothetical protein